MTVSRRSLLAAGASSAALGVGLTSRPAAAATGLPPQQAGSRYVRRDLATLVDPITGGWDPALYWFAKAVGWMMEQPADRWNSWLFQAYTHGSPRPADGAEPPEWRQCPHGSKYFLPWHRWYVYYFERIIRDVIVTEFGRYDQRNWALPYWNYAYTERSGGPPAEEFRKVPLAFREEYLPSGLGGRRERNPLYRPFGDPRGRCIDKDQAMPEEAVSPDGAMSQQCFFPEPETPESPPGFSVWLEEYPHGVVHDAVGGLMGQVPTAAQDPVFWMHHCNVDRMWCAWLNRDGHTLPTDWRWPKVRPHHKNNPDAPDQPFVFRDENGKSRVLKGPVFDFPQHAYAYDSLTEGTGSGRPPAAGYLGRQPSTVRATASAGTETHLTQQQTVIELNPENDRSNNQLRDALQGDGNVALVLHGVRADEPVCDTFRVFLGDERGDTAADSSAFVANLVFFGAVGQRLGAHDDNGHTLSFDVTKVLSDVLATGAWDGTRTPAVRVVPVHGRVAPGADARVSEVELVVP